MKPNWRVLRLNLELKTYFKSDVWKNLDLKAYCDFMVDRILGTADAKGRRTNPIWVEPEFKKPRYAEKLEKILTNFQYIGKTFMIKTLSNSTSFSLLVILTEFLNLNVNQ